MKNRYILLLFLFLLNFIVSSFGQEFKRDVAQQQNAWLVLENKSKLTENLGYTMEAQIRRSELFLNPQQLLFRTGIDYYLNNNSSITTGYAFVRTWPYGKQPIDYENNEQRIWQQLMTNSKAGRLLINHRYRLEQRWLEKFHITPENLAVVNDYHYVNRFRYRLMFQVPLNKALIEEKTIFIAIANESFINFGNVQNNVFDQNRSYIGIGYKFNSNSTLQLGYLNQLILKADGNKIENNHNIHLLVTYNLPGQL